MKESNNCLSVLFNSSKLFSWILTIFILAYSFVYILNCTQLSWKDQLFSNQWNFKSPPFSIRMFFVAKKEERRAKIVCWPSASIFSSQKLRHFFLKNGNVTKLVISEEMFLWKKKTSVFTIVLRLFLASDFATKFILHGHWSFLIVKMGKFYGKIGV